MTIYLADYQTFQTKTELNENVTAHLNSKRFKLNPTAIHTLNIISRYAVKFMGAAWLKIDTLSQLIGKSTATTRRALALLEKIGIIKRIPFIRPKRGGNGGNIIQILPNDCPQMIAREEVTKPEASTVKPSKSQNEPFSFYKQNKSINNTSQFDQSHSQSDMCNQSICEPTTFYQAFCNRIRGFIHDVDKTLLRALYGVYRAQSIPMLKFGIYKDKQSQFEQLALQSLNITIQATKKKPIRNLTGFFNGVFKNLILKHIIELDDSIPANDEPLEWFIPAHR